MLVRFRRGLPASWRPHQQPLLNQIGLVDLFQSACILSDGRRQGVRTHGPSLEFVDDGRQDSVVHVVQALLVHLEGVQGVGRDFRVDHPRALHLRKVPHPAQQGIADPGCAPRTRRDLVGRCRLDLDSQDARRPLHDVGQRLGVVVVEAKVDAKPCPQGRRQQARPRGRPHQGERTQFNLDCPRVGARVDDKVNAVVLHGAVEVLLDHGRQPVDLVDEQHVVGLEAREKTRQVTWFVQHRTRRGADGHTHLVGHDVGQGRFPKSWRAVQQHVVQRLATLPRSLHEHLQVVHGRTLAREVFKLRGPKHSVQVAVGRLFSLSPYVKVVVVHHVFRSYPTNQKSPHRSRGFCQVLSRR